MSEFYRITRRRFLLVATGLLGLTVKDSSQRIQAENGGLKNISRHPAKFFRTLNQQKTVGAGDRR